MLLCKKMLPNFSAGIPVTHLSWPAGVGDALNAEAAGVGGGGWPGARRAPPQQQQGPRGDRRPGGARQCTCEGNRRHCVGSIFFPFGKNFLNAQ